MVHACVAKLVKGHLFRCQIGHWGSMECDFCSSCIHACIDSLIVSRFLRNAALIFFNCVASLVLPTSFE